MEPIQLIIAGLGAGAIYALAALGIIVSYRVSGVVNFAQGAIAMAGAYVSWDLNVHAGMPTAVAFVLALAFSALLGLLTHLILRFMPNAAPLQKLIATLGVLIILQSIAELRYGSNTETVASILPNSTLHFGGLDVGEDRLILVGIAIAIAFGLYVLYRVTEFGRATTAVTESPLFASSCGYSPERIAAINWGLGGLLGGLAGILITPISGLNPGNLTLVIVPALVAALIANFRSFPIAVASGLAIGAIEALGTSYVSQPGFGEAVPFIILVVVLLFRGQSLPERGVSLQRLPEVGDGKSHPWLVTIASIVAVWLFASVISPTWVNGIGISIALAIVCLSIVLVTGYAGQISLAQYTLAGVGAFISSRLVATHNIPFLLALLAGVVGTVPVGLVVGIPALRSRGISLAIATLGLSVVIDDMVFENFQYTGGLNGTNVGNPTLFGWNINSVSYPQRYAIVTFVAFVLCALLVLNIRRGVIGRRLVAVRENERAAAALGINIAGVKMYAFSVAAGIAAVGGVLMAFHYSYVDFSAFSPIQSITTLGITVVGGIGLVLGALTGALALAPGGAGATLGNYIGWLVNYLPLIGGISLVVVLVLHPDGIGSDVARLGNLLKRLTQMVLGRLPVRSRKLWRRKRTDQDMEIASGTIKVKPETFSVEGLTVKFGGVTALSDVSLTVAPGTVVGLIGPNGAGKTTFIDSATGFTRITEGAVRLGTRELNALTPFKRARAGISRSFQSLELFEAMTVEENLRAACESSTRKAYVQAFLPTRWRPLSQGAKAAIREFSLEADLQRRPRELPYSRRRLVAIARAISVVPSILLLDEPAAGLDEHERVELGHLVRRLADEWGIGILIVEHDVDLIMGVCDQITVLNFGRQIASGAPNEVRNHPDVISAYLGDTGTGASLPTGGSAEQLL